MAHDETPRENCGTTAEPFGRRRSDDPFAELDPYVLEDRPAHWDRLLALLEPLWARVARPRDGAAG